MHFDEFKDWFPNFYWPQMIYPHRGGKEIVAFTKKMNMDFLKRQKSLDRLQLANFHLKNVEIPQNLLPSCKVKFYKKCGPLDDDYMTPKEQLRKAFKWMKTGFSWTIPILVVCCTNDEWDIFNDYQVWFNRPKPLFYHKANKSPLENIKSWVYGDQQKCDLVTDPFHAAGFEHDFVIVIGNPKFSISAASRATTKLAFIAIKE